MSVKFLLATCLIALALSAVKADEYDNKIVYTIYKSDNTSFIWELGTNLTEQGCDKNGKFAFIYHGFLNSVSLWGKPLADELNEARGGCVAYVNWGAFSDTLRYGKVVLAQFQGIADSMTRRLKGLVNEGVSVEDLFLVGHSLGGRLVLMIGEAFDGQIPFIDALDPAGPLFFFESILFKDSKKSAKNVMCVHTSVDFGTIDYDCHQSWVMGGCGVVQCAQKPITWVASQLNLRDKDLYIDIAHNLANVYYINSFKYDFLADNCNCRTISNAGLPKGFKMGYNESRRNSSIIAKIASPAGKTFPFNQKDCCASSILSSFGSN